MSRRMDPVQFEEANKSNHPWDISMAFHRDREKEEPWNVECHDGRRPLPRFLFDDEFVSGGFILVHDSILVMFVKLQNTTCDERMPRCDCDLEHLLKDSW